MGAPHAADWPPLPVLRPPRTPWLLRLTRGRGAPLRRAGAYLSEPITEKETTSGEDSRLRYGVSSMQGWRTSMEDAHAVRLRCRSGLRCARCKTLPAR